MTKDKIQAIETARYYRHELCTQKDSTILEKTFIALEVFNTFIFVDE